jgi:ribonuclease-3
LIFLFHFPFSAKDKAFKKKCRSCFGFTPGNAGYYRQAFRHKSLYPSVNDNNERLEFLGDSVLTMVINDHIFHTYPSEPEGFLSDLRAKLTNRAFLNSLAIELGITDCIEADKNVFSDRIQPNVFGNALEALIGAIYLDKGYTFTKKFVADRIIGRLVDVDELRKAEFNYKGRLFELMQKENLSISIVTEESVVSGMKHFSSKVFIDGRLMGEGQGIKKKEAEQAASEIAYTALMQN